MRSHELTLGRTFGVVFEHGDDFFAALTKFCHDNNIRQGYIPAFIAGFSEVEIVGTCARLDDPQAPVWTSVHLTNVEAFGGGTLAFDVDNGRVAHTFTSPLDSRSTARLVTPVTYSMPLCSS